jgi:hypothetical protein
VATAETGPGKRRKLLEKTGTLVVESASAAAAAVAVDDDVVEIAIFVPVLLNTKPLIKGEELVLAKEKVVKPRCREPVAISLAKLAKQFRAAQSTHSR